MRKRICIIMGEMKPMWIISLLLASVLLLLSGCTAAPKENGTETELGRSLTIYVAEEERWWKRAAEDFWKAHEGIELDVVSFATNAELESKLMEELEAGAGPDVVLWSAYTSRLDMRRLAEAEYLLPMDEFLAEDASFAEENYFAPVLECGRLHGQQLILPAAFQFPAVVTAAEIFESTGLSGQTVQMRDFLEAVSQEAGRTAEDAGHAAFAYQYFQGLPGCVFFGDLLTVDRSQWEVRADEQGLRELCDLFAVLLQEAAKAQTIITDPTDFEKLADSISFLYTDTDPAVSLGVYMSGHETPAAFALSAFDGDGVTAQSVFELAVNKNSADPETAYSFIRSVMDGGPYRLYDDPTVRYAYPVSRAGMERLLTVTAAGTPNVSDDYTACLRPALEDALERLDSCVSWSAEMGEQINKALAPYILGQDSFENCLAQLLDALELYIAS